MTWDELSCRVSTACPSLFSWSPMSPEGPWCCAWVEMPTLGTLSLACRDAAAGLGALCHTLCSRKHWSFIRDVSKCIWGIGEVVLCLHGALFYLLQIGIDFLPLFNIRAYRGRTGSRSHHPVYPLMFSLEGAPGCSISSPSTRACSCVGTMTR